MAAFPSFRRHDEPEGTPGRCSNLDYCSIGMQRVLVKVPVGQPFTCPECGGKLRPPSEGRAGRPWVMPALRILILLAGVLLGGVQGYLLGRVQPAVHSAVSTMSEDTEIKLNTARAMLGLPKLPPQVLAPEAATPATAAPPPATSLPPPARSAQERAYATATPALDGFGQVTIDCALAAAHDTPSCHVVDAHGGDAFPQAALDGLKTLAVRYAATRHDSPGAQINLRWRLTLEDFTGAAPPAAPPQPARPQNTAHHPPAHRKTGS